MPNATNAKTNATAAVAKNGVIGLSSLGSCLSMRAWLGQAVPGRGGAAELRADERTRMAAIRQGTAAWADTARPTHRIERCESTRPERSSSRWGRTLTHRATGCRHAR